MLLYLALPLVVILASICFLYGRQILVASRLPGPRGWPIIGNTWMFLNLSPPGFLQLLFDLKKEYGTFVKAWIGPELSCFVTDPKDVEVYFLNLIKHFYGNKSFTFNFKVKHLYDQCFYYLIAFKRS